MPKQKTDDLIQLIKSLTRAEKRHFRLFVRRNQTSDDILFLKLFDFLDRHKEYQEELILKRLPDIKKSQLSNLKAHLYKQLLVSLRLLNVHNTPDIQIREMIDYAKVLYDKGLYRQGLEVLEKAKEKALKGQFHIMALDIVEFEKHIEGQYITRSIEGRADELTKQAEELRGHINKSDQFSNLAIQLYGLYLKVGYVRNQKEQHFISNFFHAQLPKIDYQELDFQGKLNYCRAFSWYYHISQDFPLSYKYAHKWVALFHENDTYIDLYAPLYLKGLHNLLNALFNTLQYDRFLAYLDELNRFGNKEDLLQNNNVEGLYYLFKYIHTIKKHYLEGTFTEGCKLIPELDSLIKEDRYNWDDHRIMLFYYRIACLYFGSGDNEAAIDYLNLIINQKNPDYRADIQCFARILNLIAHFELGNAQLVEYQIKSVFRFLLKMEELHAVQKEILRFLRRLPKTKAEDLKMEWINLKNKLAVHEADPFQRRPFLYLDIISWLEAKIEQIPVQEVIRRKFLKRG
ncbi:MAG TPA: hypothetical protein PKA00_09920 [Saprospiraceae bacterium]|nr:hypothetical protein [Saprospiraceae bacterium]HMQ83214.1 hypothetical protein [Saprospiraceae bacterium]